MMLVGGCSKSVLMRSIPDASTPGQGKSVFSAVMEGQLVVERHRSKNVVMVSTTNWHTPQ